MQFDLFSTPATAAPANSLFLALLPDAETARQMVSVATEIRGRHSLSGKIRPVDHLHITLHDLGDYREIPAALVGALDKLCASFAAQTQPLEIVLDQAVSYTRGRGNNPLVLKPDETSTAGLSEFQQGLVRVLKAGVKGPSFNPHVTLLYDANVIPLEHIAPMRWTALEIVLINSEQGKTRHHHLARWPLAQG